MHLQRPLHVYLFVHIIVADLHLICTSVHRRTGRICAEWVHKLNLKPVAALDIGCAVGGTSFELSREFERVVGIDFSQAFVDAANNMKRKGRAQFEFSVEGELTAEATAVLPDGTFPGRVTFQQVCCLNSLLCNALFLTMGWCLLSSCRVMRVPSRPCRLSAASHSQLFTVQTYCAGFQTPPSSLLRSHALLHRAESSFLFRRTRG